MDGEPAAEIRFFSLTSRIGRLRYLAYGIGLGLLALVPGSLCLLLAFAAPRLGWPLFALLEIALLVMNVGFMVRRLHDMDKSGWWSLLILVPLINLIFWLVLVFAPGTIGENGYGAPPPPNSTWVIAGACSFLLVPVGLAAIALPAYGDFTARAQMSEAIELATGAETAVTEYAQDKQAWPTDLTEVYDAAKQDPSWRYVASVTATHSADGSAYGVIVTMKSARVKSSIAGTAMEVWSNDQGQTWHCGPASVNPVEARYLPGFCRDTEPSPP